MNLNLDAPVKNYMIKEVLCVHPGDNLEKVKQIFDEKSIHHLPVLDGESIVGLVSKSDMLFFLRGFTQSKEDRFINEARLTAFRVDEIMTRSLFFVEPGDSLRDALQIFLKNRFHAVPVVSGGKLEGILTTFDIIRHLATD